jgi:hypothetical protein
MLPELSMMKMMDGEAGLLPVTTWTFSEQTGMTGSSQITSLGTLMVADAKLPGHLAKTKLQIRALWTGKHAVAQKAETTASLNVKTLIGPPKYACLVARPWHADPLNIPSNNGLGLGLLFRLLYGRSFQDSLKMQLTFLPEFQEI